MSEQDITEMQRVLPVNGKAYLVWLAGAKTGFLDTHRWWSSSAQRIASVGAARDADEYETRAPRSTACTC